MPADLFASQISDFLKKVKEATTVDNADLKQVANKWLKRIRKEFVDSKDPYGTGWKRTKRSGKPLVKTGRLMRSFEARIQRGILNVDSDVDYAAEASIGAGHIKRLILPDSRGLPENWYNDLVEQINNKIKEKF